MDCFARALLAADAVLHNSPYLHMRAERYASFDSGEGQKFESGKMSLSALAKLAGKNGEPQQRSGRQELFENIINSVF